MKLYQTIYEHGGSRIWAEDDKGRHLIADTYGDNPNMAIAVFNFLDKWLKARGGEER